MLVRGPGQVYVPENAAGEGRGAAAPVINDLIHTLREARRELRIRQLELAARLGVTEITLIEWEMRRDIPATGNFLRWAHELGYAVQVRRSSSGESPRGAAPSPEISQTLRQARVESGLTQEELGTELGVSTWTVGMWESAQRTPRLVHLVAWCRRLDCHLALAKF